MPVRLIFSIVVILIIGAVTKMVSQQIGFIANNAEIMTASSEVHEIAKVVYIDYVSSSRNLSALSQNEFAAYLRKRVKIDDPTRDSAKDPWLMPYRIMVWQYGGYEIRSAGPDLEFDTDDDIVAEGH
ncbi:conserved hypothetical protein [Gammaproteobacteria bacterium]